MKIAGGIISVMLTLVVGTFVAAFFLLPRCDSGSKSVTMARALSEERLAQLHEDMIFLRLEILVQRNERRKMLGYDGDDIPSQFADLHAIKVRPFSENIMLEGCFDHHVYLHFYGIGESEEYGDHSPRIELSYGEHPVRSEVLWRPAGKAGSEQGEGGNAI